MLEKSEVKIHREFVRRVRHSRRQLEPKITAGSHHILIVSDRSASQTLWNGRNVAAHQKTGLQSSNQLQSSTLQSVSM
jgi:hypothetical protein